MQSPFKIFRKHQKWIMAVMVFAAIILFGIGDTLMKMVNKGGSLQAGTYLVETNIGGLSQIEMQNLRFQRQNLQRFISLAYQRSHAEELKGDKAWLMQYMVRNAVMNYGFGEASPPNLLYAWLHRHEARQMGIVVSDTQIQDYINRFTDRKLTSDDFRTILDDMHISVRQLYDTFRGELQASIAYQMKVPAELPSPEKYWEYYRQLKTRQKIEVAALPVADFMDSVPQPSEAQIAALFEKHKHEFEQAYGGEFKPGFRQQRKVKLHYLTLSPSSVEDKVQAAGPVTDKEIEDYYEKHKDTDRRMFEMEAIPDETEPINPEFAPEPPTGPALDANEPPESSDKPSADSGDKPSECTPGIAADDDAQEKPEGSAAPAGKKSDEPDATPANEPAGETKTDDAGDEQKPGTGKGAAEADASDAGPADESTAKAPSSDGKKKFQPPARIKYKPLDDNLREQIRDSVINDRRRKLLKEQTAMAVKRLQDVGLKFATSPSIKLTDPDASQLKELDRKSEEELRKIADSLGMRFSKTDLVTARELGEIDGLGKAFEPFSIETVRNELTTIIQQAFSGEALCRVFQSEGSDSTTYICWKVQDAPVHIPALDDPGIRDQVVKAWKRIEALPLARKRAEDLAERARHTDKEFAESLTGQTVTGDPKGAGVTVNGPSPEFSFYEDSAAPATRRQAADVRLGNPIYVNNAGRTFMHVIFDKLSEGEVGPALNDDASVYYVVKVTSRREASREAFKDALLFDRASPYYQVARVDRQIAASEYTSRLTEKYAVKWSDAANRDLGPMSDEE